MDPLGMGQCGPLRCLVAGLEDRRLLPGLSTKAGFRKPTRFEWLGEHYLPPVLRTSGHRLRDCMFVLLPSGRVSDRQSVWVFCNREMGVSENRGPQYSTLTSRIPLIFGNSQIPVRNWTSKPGVRSRFGPTYRKGSWDLVTRVIIRVTILIITWNPN